MASFKQMWWRGRIVYVGIRKRSVLPSADAYVRGNADLAINSRHQSCSGTKQGLIISSPVSLHGSMTAGNPILSAIRWRTLSTLISRHRIRTHRTQTCSFPSKTWRGLDVNTSRRHVSPFVGGRWGKQEPVAADGEVRGIARREEEVLEALAAVHEPCTNKEVVQLGLVQDLRIGSGFDTLQHLPKPPPLQDIFILVQHKNTLGTVATTCLIV